MGVVTGGGRDFKGRKSPPPELLKYSISSEQRGRHQHGGNLTARRLGSFIFGAAGLLHGDTSTPVVFPESCFTFSGLPLNFSRP